MSTATSTNESYNPGLTRTANSSTDDSEDAYLLISKIMVVALAVLIAVVLFVIGVHICARWMWRITPASRRAGDPPWLSFWPTGWRSTGSPANNSPDDDLTVMDADALETDTTVGLDKATVEALPTFRYKTARHLEQGTEIWMAMECAICLGDFEEDEVGRILPKCGHSFHLECIDMWLYSHSTCPLCRAILEPHEDDALSADFETAIQLDPTAASRRVRGRETYQHILPQVSEEDEAYEQSRTEPLAESLPTTQQAQEHEAAKRAVSIPANVLFWGNHTQQLPSAESRLSTVVNTSLQTPFHVAIDVDVPSAPHDQRDSSPNAGSPPSPSRSSFIVSPVSRTSVNFRRLFSRGRLPPSAALASTTGGAIELPAVMTSP